MPDPVAHVQRTERFDLNALYETSRLLSSSLDLEFVLNNLLLTAMSKLLVMRGAVLLYDPLLALYRVASVKGAIGFKQGETLELALPDGSNLLMNESVPPNLREKKIALLIPVRSGHREIGLIALGEKATRQKFERAEMEFISSLVNMSSAAVHNSLMVEELKLANRDLDSKIQQLNTLFDLSKAFNAVVDRDRLVKQLSFALMGHMLVAKYLFMIRSAVAGGDIPDDEQKRFQVVASKGITNTRLEPELIDKLCKTRDMVLLQNETAGPDWDDFRKRGITLVIPIQQHDETCAVLCLGPKMTGHLYQPDDIEFLYALGNLALVSIQNTYLVEEQIERQRLAEEMKLAREIQLRLLPQEIPEFVDIDVAALAYPAREVGGDFFDVAKLEGSRLLVAIADVTGKGIPAALLMANLQASLHILFPLPVTIEEAASHMNRVICENTGFDKFITYFHGIYHHTTGEFEYVNAGHNPPIVIKANGNIERLEIGGLLLGIMKGLPYEKGTISLGHGDLLVLFTDGVTEAMGEAEEEYGEERLLSILNSNLHLSAKEILEAVRVDIAAFTGDPSRLSDDLTAVVLKVKL